MTNEQRHGCGGILTPVTVAVSREIGGLFFEFSEVDGLRCSQCGIEVIERGTALELEQIATFITQQSIEPERGVVITTSMPMISLRRTPVGTLVPAL